MIKRSVRFAAAFVVGVSSLLMTPVMPAHAAPQVETIIIWGTSSAADGRLMMVYALHSEDHRCTLGRTVMYEYRTSPGGPWKVAAKDTSVYTPAMGIYFKPPQDVAGARVRIPATTLSDGTKCLAPPLASGRTASPSALFTVTATSSTRVIPSNTWLDDFDGAKALEEWVIYGVVGSSVKACRAKRDVYTEVMDSPDVWVRMGRDKTPKSGMFAMTVGIPDDIGPLRVRVLGRTLPNGTKCDPVTYIPA